ncbi:MAG: hypothetical protein N2689_05345 [Verrucomicrobiae bacterium]|nr:hypothetical protein [Verrucomicrobiae bacterium]
MKNAILLLGAIASAAWALDAKPPSSVPAFAADWRVTGIIRQGGGAQASLEHPSVRSRFVKEGDRLPGDITVVAVSYAERSVTLTNGKETAVLRAGNAMAAPPPPPKSITMIQQEQMQAAMKNMAADRNQGPKGNFARRGAVTRDANGNWVIQYGDGRTMDMQSYAQRFGGIEGAMAHVQERLKGETDPERIEYRKQQLKALKAMRKAGQQ